MRTSWALIDRPPRARQDRGTVASERVQARIDRLLNEAEEAADRLDWDLVRQRAEGILAFDPENQDAQAFLAASERASSKSPLLVEPINPQAAREQPDSFASGRYTVKRFLGEGGKKQVFLAHDASLDRDVAFALIKTEGLDAAARERITREAQAMGRLGAHPHIVTVFDIGDEAGQPYLVLPVLGGGDVEGIIEKAPEHKLPIEQAIKIAVETCLGLEFAHGKGIIHRDIKPGNVWLTEDGRAMVGDFGLAVAVDRSRLTQAGMMVGTVNYMPPEQAMGGEITPRSDLYALGAMLYEMVCGRPPFIGDESVAIIGQHLNTPPVAPTWHRPDCPPALEGLILRLLEKDPGKRPESATEVREALQAIGQPGNQPATQTAGVQPPAAVQADPLYRRTFVGRENEVRQLQQAFDGAMSGNGGLVMVVGEPGIGKTALCEQLATYVGLRGGKALVGHCYEEGSLSLPYLAFVEAMRSYVLARDPEALRSELGTGAGEVARIVSEVRDRLQGVELRPAGDPEDDRWRLLQAVTSFLRNASTVQPLCIVLEDLHWADRGTLDLLLHVSRYLVGARLLIVGTYRDVEVDRSHPLSATLADLRREANFTRVPLRGLTVDEVHRMYEAVRGQETPWAHAEAVHRATEGNPLFVQEVLRYLVEEGFVVREDGRYVAASGVGAGIPEGLRDVVGKRLSRLGEKTNQALAIAAVMGRDFRLDVLQLVVGFPEEDLYSALAEAVERAIIEERSGVGAAVAYRFAHAFFRTTLYEETIAPRRIRLHQQVARALETVYGRRLEEHAAELAEHYSYSSSPDDLRKAVEYGELAAQRASLVFDYGEAERHLQQALKVQEVLDPDDKLRRCDLLHTLGEAMLPQEEPRRVADTVAEEAFALAEAAGRPALAARAAVQALESMYRAGFDVEAHSRWAQRADRYAQPGTVERVYADLGMSTLVNLTSGPAAGHALNRRAIAEARPLADPAPFFAAAGYALAGMTSLGDRDLISGVVDDLMSRTHVGVRSRDLAVCLAGAIIVRLGRGERGPAEAMMDELSHLSERTGDHTIENQAMAGPLLIAILDGRLQEAVVLHQERRAHAVEHKVTAFINGRGLGRPPLFLGTAADYLVEFENPLRAVQAARALFLAYLGRLDDAREIAVKFPGVVSDDDESGMHVIVNLLETAILCADEATTSALIKRLQPLQDEGYFGLDGMAVSFGRLLGDGARLLNRPTEAREYYASALEYCAKLAFRPEIALIRLDLAELLLEEYPDEHITAIEHLDFAIAELRDMKMQPALERALRHRGLLKA